MEHLQMQSRDMVSDNMKYIAERWPECLTEAKDENGKLRQLIDFDKLRQVLSADATGEGQERYQFTWPDKRHAIRLANTPITDTLRPCREESVDWNTTQNLYIEGDNLNVLKLLRESYLGKVKMIYIDPPYNTGGDFVYKDNFIKKNSDYAEVSGAYDKEGNLLVGELEKNADSNGRFHTDWLNMIYPRLKVARDLLSEDGVIFISIDDNEVENLRKVCDEVFGEGNFVGDISWQRTYSTRNDSQGLPQEVEHIMAFSKTSNWNPKALPRTAEMNAMYKNPDNDVSMWRNDNPFASDAATHQGMVYAIQHPFTGELIYPYSNGHWRYGQDEMLNHMNGWCEYELRDLHDEEKRAAVCGITITVVRKGVKGIVLKESLELSRQKAQAVYDRGQWPKFYFTKGGTGGIGRKTYLDKVGGKLPTNFWAHTDTGHTDEAKKELKALFDGEIPFDTPKPVRLLERMIQIATDEDSLIIDFFSGSATTAHAVMKKNVEDGGKRKFIMIQIPERIKNPNYKTLCDVGKERIRRAGKKIKDESPLTTQDLDTGFRVLKLDSSNMQDVFYAPAETTQQTLFADNIKPDRTGEDLLMQVMLELGIQLSDKIETTEIAGKTVWNVSDGYLMACFDTDVNEDTIKAIAKQKPAYFVLADRSLASDNVADNFEQLFEEYSPDTVRRII